MKLVVIGAGPVGLAAAFGARARGLDVSVLERGAVGESLRRWGPTRLFTPLGMNLWPGARSLGVELPADHALLSGPEMAERVLAPLAERLGDCVRTHHRVVAVGRARLGRGELHGHPLRAERPFRLLVETPRGEQVLEADRVIDASGVYQQPRALGAGGVPAPGEAAAEGRIVRDLGALESRRAALAGRRVLLVGHGHSAANALAVLDGLAREHAGTQLTWAVRSAHARPCVEACDDPLPERQRVAAHANQLAERPPPHLAVERRASVEALAEVEGALAVSLTSGRRVEVDHVVSLTGYRPDLSMLAELGLEISPRTEGAARLDRAICSITDCLSVPSVRAEDLGSGEPGFFFAGHKSYGRVRTFLLATGYAQLEMILEQL
jgi:thioredoxin reductase